MSSSARTWRESGIAQTLILGSRARWRGLWTPPAILNFQCNEFTPFFQRRKSSLPAKKTRSINSITHKEQGFGFSYSQPRSREAPEKSEVIETLNRNTLSPTLVTRGDSDPLLSLQETAGVFYQRSIPFLRIPKGDRLATLFSFKTEKAPDRYFESTSRRTLAVPLS